MDSKETLEDGRDKERKEEEELNTKNHGNFNDEKWEGTFRRLKAFKTKYGHTQIPYRYTEDPKLGRWVSIQRSLYKRLRDGTDESSTLTEERIQKLDEIGFEWKSADHRAIPWESRYQELVEFARKYGHSQVPIRWADNVQLATWISAQRQEYKYLQSGRPTRLTKERIKKLNEVNFVWNAKQKRVPEQDGEGQGKSDSKTSSSRKAVPVGKTDGKPPSTIARGDPVNPRSEQSGSDTANEHGVPHVSRPSKRETSSLRSARSDSMFTNSDIGQDLQSTPSPLGQASANYQSSSATLMHTSLPQLTHLLQHPLAAQPIRYFQNPRDLVLTNAYPFQGVVFDRSIHNLNAFSSPLAATMPSLEQVILPYQATIQQSQPSVWQPPHLSTAVDFRFLPSLPASFDLLLASLPPGSAVASNPLLRLRNERLEPQPDNENQASSPNRSGYRSGRETKRRSS